MNTIFSRFLAIGFLFVSFSAQGTFFITYKLKNNTDTNVVIKTKPETADWFIFVKPHTEVKFGEAWRLHVGLALSKTEDFVVRLGPDMFFEYGVTTRFNHLSHVSEIAQLALGKHTVHEYYSNPKSSIHEEKIIGPYRVTIAAGWDFGGTMITIDNA